MGLGAGPEYEAKLAWARAFVDNEIIPLETLSLDYDALAKVIAPLQEQVKAEGALGGAPSARARGNGVRAGASRPAPRDIRPYLPCADRVRQQCPRLGERRAARHRHRGVQAARSSAKFLEPLLDGRLKSAFSMTEPGAGADPTLISTSAHRDGDEWVINGHKWFTSNGSVADFLIVMCVTNADVHPYQGSSMIIVPADTPGVEMLRDVPTMEDPTPHFHKYGGRSEMVYKDVRVPPRRT